MAEESISRPHAHPLQAAPTNSPGSSDGTAGVPDQRAPGEVVPPLVAGTERAEDEVDDDEEAVPEVMSLARLTLAVIFGMLLLGLVLSYLLARA